MVGSLRGSRPTHHSYSPIPRRVRASATQAWWGMDEKLVGLNAYSFTCYPLSEHLEQAILHLRGGGVTPYDGLYGEALPERGVFFRLQAYEMVGIPLAEVYERVGKSVIWVCERAQKSEQINLWLNKVEKIKEG